MIKIKSPGRICLFGEHQDYLGYPIISLAISKYIYIEAIRITEPKLMINLPDTSETLEIILNHKELEYESKRDYIKSGYNQFLRMGVNFQKGYEIKINGDIPINAGVASSSALVICWLYFLNIISDRNLKPFQLAIEGYNTEVKEFQEGGGMMDHFTSVFGNLIYLKPEEPKPQLRTYDFTLDGFVLGNSKEKKATVADLIKTKQSSLEAYEVLNTIFPKFNYLTTKLEEIQPYLTSVKEEHKKKILGNLKNRDITFRAFNLINNYNQNKFPDNQDFYIQLGNLLNLHHQNLRDYIQVSTRKIDDMISASLEAGALGGKINGSGFGGTMFALTLKNKNLLKSAIEKVGGKADILKCSNGVEKY